MAQRGEPTAISLHTPLGIGLERKVATCFPRWSNLLGRCSTRRSVQQEGAQQMTVVEVFADVACPFTHVGLRRFVERRAELGRGDVTLWVRAWPLEIVNGEPLDPHFIAEEVDDIRRAGRADIVRWIRRGFVSRQFAARLALAAAAYEQDLATGERVSLALRDLLFERGVDIADAEVLRRLAADHDVPVDLADTRRVLDDHAKALPGA